MCDQILKLSLIFLESETLAPCPWPSLTSLVISDLKAMASQSITV